MKHLLHKEVPVGAQLFRVGRLSPEDGSWLVVLLTTKMREARQRQSLGGPDPEPDPDASFEEKQAAQMSIEEGMMMTASFLIAQLTRAELREVMSMCLQVCDRMETPDGSPVPIPMPVMLGDRYAIPEMRKDGPSCLQLTKETVAFNIVPFLHAGESN
jgi:hypothetical protein